MSTNSPFDEPALTDEPVHPALRRKRRPWWRWNVITLAVALFALIWLRELFDFELGMVWTLSLSVFFVWGLGPAFFVPKWITTVAAYADAEEGPRLQPWAGNLPIVVLKVIAVGLGVFSLVHLMVAVYAVVTADYNQGGMFVGAVNSTLLQRLMQYSWVILQPVTQFVAAATLFVLAEIALRIKPQ